MEESRESLVSFHSFNKYLLSTCYILDIDLGIGNTAQNDRKKNPTKPCPLEPTFYKERQTANK